MNKLQSIQIYEDDGKEKQIIERYKAVASEFTKLGYPAVFKCYCDQCANRYFPSGNQYIVNNFVFSVSRPDDEKTVNSYPSTHSFDDFEYKITLAFLRGADTISKLSAATGTKLTAESYLEHVHNVLGSEVADRGDDSK